jgi:phosphatidylglycerol:prolipoprotein diacylglycerol transferase
MVGVAFAFTLLARKKKFRFKEIILLFDIVLVIVPLGIMLGRIGNFLNQELYGILVPEHMR